MTQVKMPEPVAWMLAYQTMGGDVGWKLSWTQSGAGVCHRLSGESHEKPLITTTQAEAYKDACVREALTEVAEMCDNVFSFSVGDSVRDLMYKMLSENNTTGKC